MRRFSFASLLCGTILGLVAWAQSPGQAGFGQGIQNAPEAHPYTPPSPSASAEELESRGDEFRRQKAFADALDYYRAALARSHDKSARASLHNKIGLSELQMQRFHDAEKSFERALKLQGDLIEGHNNLGVCFYLEKKIPKAIKESRLAVSLEEGNASFHYNLATALLAHNELEAGIAEFARAFQLDPTIFERSTRGGVAAKLANPQDRAKFAYMLARMYARMGDLDRSIQCLKKAMEDGYKDMNNVYKDQDFSGLRADPRFAELMASRPVAIPE